MEQRDKNFEWRYMMRELKQINNDGVLLTYEQVARAYNLGISTVTRLARESGALVKIGKSARVDPVIFREYVRQMYQSDTMR